MRSILLSIVVLVACGGSEEPETSASTTGDERVADTTTAEEEPPFGLMNGARPLDAIYTAGQPSGEAIEAAYAGGVRTVISLRPESEPGQDEELAAIARLGMRFERIPVSGPDDLTLENARRLEQLLTEASEHGETLVHCGSSNRAGSLIAMRAFFIENASLEDALELGRAAGLTHLEGRVREILQQACADAPDDARC